MILFWHKRKNTTERSGLRKNGDCLLRCDHEHRTAVYWLFKEQIGDRLNPIPGGHQAAQRIVLIV